MPGAIINYNRVDPHAEEDRRLVLMAKCPENPHVLDHLKLGRVEIGIPVAGLREKSAIARRPGYATYGD